MVHILSAHRSGRAGCRNLHKCFGCPKVHGVRSSFKRRTCDHETGRLVTEDNQRLLSEADLDEWNAAIEEYEAKHQKPPQYPIGTVAMYGPDDKTTTKIAAGVIVHDGAEAIIQRWVATNVTTNPKVQQEMKELFLQHCVKSVAMSDGNMGCPHEEGMDFPHGEDCPFCPFWKGKQGSNRRE